MILFRPVKYSEAIPVDLEFANREAFEQWFSQQMRSRSLPLEYALSMIEAASCARLMTGHNRWQRWYPVLIPMLTGRCNGKGLHSALYAKRVLGFLRVPRLENLHWTLEQIQTTELPTWESFVSLSCSGCNSDGYCSNLCETLKQAATLDFVLIQKAYWRNDGDMTAVWRYIHRKCKMQS